MTGFCNSCFDIQMSVWYASSLQRHLIKWILAWYVISYETLTLLVDWISAWTASLNTEASYLQPFWGNSNPMRCPPGNSPGPIAVYNSPVTRTVTVTSYAENRKLSQAIKKSIWCHRLTAEPKFNIEAGRNKQHAVYKQHTEINKMMRKLQAPHYQITRTVCVGDLKSLQLQSYKQWKT